MKWSNVKLIWLREVRDQLRDRRTLFTIAVLPLLLYPLLGMSFLQVAQFMREHPTQIWILGTDALPEQPPLLEDGHFAPGLCPEAEARLLTLTITPELPLDARSEGGLRRLAQQSLQSGQYDVVIYFPPQFAEQLEKFRSRLQDGRRGLQIPPGEQGLDIEVPQPEIFVNTASDHSRIASERVERVLRAWRQGYVHETFKQNSIPVMASEPFRLVNTDVAEEVRRRAALWSKILPFVVLIWALTGAFYPAIDLCAGEKERGTLETLLSSPAERSEIVWGKLLTVMAFSMTTSMLNVLSMSLTGLFIIRQLESLDGGALQLELGAPPLATLGWLLVALVPISALFSALSLAIATFARSSKEGQYYLMPLLLITLPLMMLPMLPAAQLDLGTSLIPVTGVMLLLRSLIEGQYSEALRYALPVIGVTSLGCLLAIRWAIDQFNNESVLFRESERWGLGLWLRHVLRDRQATPSFGEAILCGVLLLLIRFFASFVVGLPDGWANFASTTLITLIGLIAAPALLMTLMLTNSPRATLLLYLPRPLTLPAALLLALLLHPPAMALAQAVQALYPFSDEVTRQMQYIGTWIEQAPNIWAVLLVMALAPAVCEELAFRGFILSGLRHSGHKWAAIVGSSIFFGAAHGILQQSITACAVGVVLGYLAIQTGSLLPAILFHLLYNSLTLLIGLVLPDVIDQYGVLQWMFQEAEQGYQYRWYMPVMGGVLGVALLYWFRRLPYQPSAEEALQQARDHDQ